MDNFNIFKNRLTKLLEAAEVFSKQAGYENISKNILKTKNELHNGSLIVIVREVMTI
jgi:hypothetical protein